MKLALIIPDRGDRPQFLKNCLRLIGMQIKQPDQILLINYPPKNSSFDLAERIQQGYSQVNSGIDVVAIMENDDWYSPLYLQYLFEEWQNFNCPDIFGIEYTHYYHLGLQAYVKLIHKGRASLMSTMLKTGLNINWNEIKNPFVDIYLWRQLKGKTISPEQCLAVGIKHGRGLCGGRAHNKDFNYSEFNSPFLKNNIDKKSLEFYENINSNSSMEAARAF